MVYMNRISAGVSQVSPLMLNESFQSPLPLSLPPSFSPFIPQIVELSLLVKREQENRTFDPLEVPLPPRSSPDSQFGNTPTFITSPNSPQPPSSPKSPSGTAASEGFSRCEVIQLVLVMGYWFD